MGIEQNVVQTLTTMADSVKEVQSNEGKSIFYYPQTKMVTAHGNYDESPLDKER